MNLDKLRGALTKNKTALMVAGAAAVGLLALRARSRSTSAGSSTSAGGYVPTGMYSTGGQTSGATGYDSTASDVYGAIQPQLESIGQMLDQINNSAGADTVPIPIADPAPTVQGYYRRTGTSAVYQALSDGTIKWLDKAAYNAAQSPKYQDVAASDPLWNRPVVGTDAPEKYRTPK